MRHCEYYEQDITSGDFEVALEAYQRWCKNNNQEPEVAIDANLDDISESELAHVLYHAEIEGFKLEDDS